MVFSMKRYNLLHLETWFNKTDRMPLIIRGARQVGKSTLVRMFCEEQGIDLLEINLERGLLKSVNKDYVKLEEVLDEIQLRTQKKWHSKSVIFLDEIQEQPSLIKFLRYFYEERPDIAVISAGSLLEIALKDEKFSFPVGRVEFQHLGPMTFTEFLIATGHQLLAEKILNKNFSDAVCDLAKNEFRNYLYVGGMPQAIKAYVETKSLVRSREIQEQILQTYMADFPKYNHKINYDRIQRVFKSAGHQLGKKLIYQRLDDQSQSRDIRRIVELLIDARILLPCIHSNGNSVPLGGEIDLTIQKIFFLDIGLINCLIKTDLDVIDSEMKNNFNTKGMLAEQFVAQHLAYLEGPSRPPDLHYWLRDKGPQKGEVDFLIEKGQKVIPVEVKSTSVGHMKSLFYFIKEKNKIEALRLSLAPYSQENIKHKIEDKIVSGHLTNLPIWAVETLKNN
jgi:uncharacterized protein